MCRGRLNTGSTSSWTGKNSTLTREGDDDDGGVFTVGDGEVQPHTS
jgi:hypothetical protein